MKIGFFSETYLPVIHGVTISIETFRKELESMGHKVYIYTLDIPGYKDKTPNVFRFKSIRIIKNPELRQLQPALHLKPVRASLEEIHKLKLDIVHAHTPFSLGVLAKSVSKEQKIPMVYTHHTDYPEYIKFYWKDKIILPRLMKVYTRLFSNLSNGIIAPSLKIKRYLRGYGVNKKIPIYVLQTGIDLNLFKKSPAAGFLVRRKLGISPQAKVLICVGRIGQEKNVEFIIRAFGEISKDREGIFLMMVGEGPFFESLKKIVKDSGLDKKVIFTGRISHDEIKDYYNAADLFVFASYTDTQGIVIIEAMACGLPVVALKDDAFSDMIADGKNSFMVNKQSEKIFAQKVNQLLGDKELYRKFSSAAIKQAAAFSKENMAKKLISVYKSLLKK